MSYASRATPLDSSWDMAAVAGKPVTLQGDGSSVFSGATTAQRAYLRTTKSDFHNASFVAEFTVTLGGGAAVGCAYVGLGAGVPAGDAEPATAPANFLRLAPSNFNNGLLTFHDNATATTIAAAGPGDGTHRVRLVWDATLKRMQADVDAGSTGGVFVRDFGQANSSASTGFAAGSARLFLGGAGGVTFGPVAVRAATANDLARIEVAPARWMSALNGSLKLSRLTIPGTHDTAARYEPLSGTAKCQDLSIADQLAVGVRFLDMRCRHIENGFAMHHGSVFQNLYFGDALAQVYAFLAANPGECVMMVVKEEHTAENNTRTFEQTFDSYVAANPGRWWLGTSVPTLDTVRGKIVLVRRFGASTAKGINATNWPDNTNFAVNNLVVEDHYVVSNNDTKWGYVTAGLVAAAAEANDAVLYITHSSGYKSGLFGIPSITTVSNSINPRINPYFTGIVPGHYGCLAMDFADATRARLVYESNFLRPGPIPDGIYRITNKHSSLALEVADAASAAGAGIVQRAWGGGDHQRWLVANLGAGRYRFSALHSQLALDIEGSSTINGGRLIQWAYAGGSNQMWQVVANGDGSHRIVNLNSGLVLDVDAASLENGAVVQQWSWGGGDHQRWILDPVNRAPVFAPNPPAPVGACVGMPFSGTLAGAASDADPGHTTIRYNKSGGPAWLQVAAAGGLSGTPPAGSAGSSTVTVLADDVLGTVGRALLAVTVIDHPVWTNPGGGSWPAAANWLWSIVGTGTGRTADFATLDLAADATVALDGARTLGGLVFADTTPSHNWTLATGGAGPLLLDVASGQPVVAVHNQAATIRVVLAGSDGLEKTGAGTLELAAANTYTGPTLVSEGTLVVNGSVGNTATTVAAAGTLGGNGTLGGGVTARGNLAPGHRGIGNLAVGSTLILAPGATIEWELADWTGAPGTGSDVVTAAALSITATASAPVTLCLTERSLVNFREADATFVIVRTAGGISGFDPGAVVLDTSALPAAAGTWAVRQSGTDLVLAYTAPDPDANGNGILDGWEIEKFGNAGPGANSATADPDRDGVANLVEYALGTDPLVPGPLPLAGELAEHDGGRHLRLSVPRNPAATNLEYIVELSDDLQPASWTTSGTTVETDPADPVRLVVRDDTPLGSAPRRFLRLRVRALE